MTKIATVTAIASVKIPGIALFLALLDRCHDIDRGRGRGHSHGHDRNHGHIRGRDNLSYDTLARGLVHGHTFGRNPDRAHGLCGAKTMVEGTWKAIERKAHGPCVGPVDA